MDVLLTIGDFSRMTYLSVKGLRHYHETGLLEPADIDPATGYRRYRPAQVPTAQVIRRLWDLGMPLEEIGKVLDAPDVAARNAGIAAHLRRMEQQLERTQATVASLRRLLEEEQPPVEVEYRSVRPAVALALSGRIGMAEADQWWGEAFDELRAALPGTGLRRAGPDGALYSAGFFQADAGDVTAFIPVAGPAGQAGTASPAGPGQVRRARIPGAELAGAMHRGSLSDLDKTYAALGNHVAERAIGVDGPIRENYLITQYDTGDEARHQAEVGWPVFLTTTRSSP
jgi:DNA-binding transcriptional MerR regulator